MMGKMYKTYNNEIVFFGKSKSFQNDLVFFRFLIVSTLNKVKTLTVQVNWKNSVVFYGREQRLSVMKIFVKKFVTCLKN